MTDGKPKRSRRRPDDPSLLAEKEARALKSKQPQDGKPSAVPEPLSSKEPKDGKKYTVTLPYDLHRRFAMHAADTGQTMLQVLSGWIREHTKTY